MGRGSGRRCIFYHQGSIDLTDFPLVSTITGGAGTSVISPSVGGFVVYEDSVQLDLYAGILPEGNTRAFGSGGQVIASSFSGDAFGVDSSDNMALPVTYVSGTQISGTTIFEGATFASLGVTPTPFSFDTLVGTNTIHFFQMPPSSPGDSALNKALLDKIKKLQKKAKAAAKKGKKAKAQRLAKQIKKLRALLA